MTALSFGTTTTTAATIVVAVPFNTLRAFSILPAKGNYRIPISIARSHHSTLANRAAFALRNEFSHYNTVQSICLCVCMSICAKLWGHLVHLYYIGVLYTVFSCMIAYVSTPAHCFTIIPRALMIVITGRRIHDTS